MVGGEHQFGLVLAQRRETGLTHLHVFKLVDMRPDPNHTFDTFSLGYNPREDNVVRRDHCHQATSDVIFLQSTRVFLVLHFAESGSDHVHR